MRRDSIFYQLFQQSPTLLFELLTTPPTNATDYRFDSVAVKEPKFEIDGVFLPPDTGSPGVVYFCEVQFQKDERLYERLFSESFLYFYRNRDRYSNWQVVAIYPSRSLEQSELQPYQVLLNSNQVHRVYLDELGEIRQLPLGVALMLLTTVEEEQAPEEARYLLARSQREIADLETSRAIMEMATTIMVYKFVTLNREEVEAMIGIRLQETRVYQEAQAEAVVTLILQQLTYRLKQDLTENLKTRITALPLPSLKALGKALLDFSTLADLEAWLAANPQDDSSGQTA